MKGLTSADSKNKLTALCLTATITWKDTIKASKKAAAAKKALTRKEDDENLDINSALDTREEADRQNIARLVAIGAKERVIDAIQGKIRSAITNSIL